jgi:hypothetical protein
LGELAACGVAARIGTGGLSFCAAVQAGSMWDRTTGLWFTRANQRVLVLVAPSAQLLLPLTSRVVVSAGLGASVPCMTLRYAYQDAGGELRVLHSVEMGLWSELALGVRFGG